jgi:hypothetical protein
MAARRFFEAVEAGEKEFHVVRCVRSDTQLDSPATEHQHELFLCLSFCKSGDREQIRAWYCLLPEGDVYHVIAEGDAAVALTAKRDKTFTIFLGVTRDGSPFVPPEDPLRILIDSHTLSLWLDVPLGANTSAFCGGGDDPLTTEVWLEFAHPSWARMWDDLDRRAVLSVAKVMQDVSMGSPAIAAASLEKVNDRTEI